MNLDSKAKEVIISIIDNDKEKIHESIDNETVKICNVKTKKLYDENKSNIDNKVKLNEDAVYRCNGLLGQNNIIESNMRRLKDIRDGGYCQKGRKLNKKEQKELDEVTISLRNKHAEIKKCNEDIYQISSELLISGYTLDVLKWSFNYFIDSNRYDFKSEGEIYREIFNHLLSKHHKVSDIVIRLKLDIMHCQTMYDVEKLFEKYRLDFLLIQNDQIFKPK